MQRERARGAQLGERSQADGSLSQGRGFPSHLPTHPVRLSSSAGARTWFPSVPWPQARSRPSPIKLCALCPAAYFKAATRILLTERPSRGSHGGARGAGLLLAAGQEGFTRAGRPAVGRRQKGEEPPRSEAAAYISPGCRSCRGQLKSVAVGRSGSNPCQGKTLPTHPHTNTHLSRCSPRPPFSFQGLGNRPGRRGLLCKYFESFRMRGGQSQAPPYMPADTKHARALLWRTCVRALHDAFPTTTNAARVKPPASASLLLLLLRPRYLVSPPPHPPTLVTLLALPGWTASAGIDSPRSPALSLSRVTMRGYRRQTSVPQPAVLSQATAQGGRDGWVVFFSPATPAGSSSP